jgi:anti-anti-sigma factor
MQTWRGTFGLNPQLSSADGAKPTGQWYPMVYGMSPIQVIIDDSTPIAVATLHGELDMATIDPVREALYSLARTSPRGLILDLGGLTFCGCAGVRMLLSLQGAVPETAAVVYARCRREVLRVMDVAGVIDDFDRTDTVEQARDHLLGTVFSPST